MFRSFWPRHWIAAAALCLAATLPHGGAAAAQPVLNLKLFASGLTGPVGIVNAHDGSNRLFIVQQGGTIKIINGSQVLTTPFLDITTKVLSGGERGLLGLAFDANYASYGLFYVYYTSQPAGAVTIARYSVTADANVANPNSEVILKTQDHSQFANHNGGSLLFGPDGCLYAGIGDGGSGGDPNGNGQNLGTLLAKIIRINPTDGSPCAGNPFIGTTGARGEIWALGVRNPWRITFDRQTGDLMIADVGQDTEEEVDFQPAGAGGRNYCWRHKEGLLIYDANTACTAGTPTDPVLVYDHVSGNCSITGGYRYRGSRIPQMVGTYFYADYCSGRIWAATESGGVWSTTQIFDTTFNISTFGEDESGELYLADLAGGKIYRLVTAVATTHDFNADFRSDILWRDNANGDVALWQMNGSQVASNTLVGNLPTAWSIVGQRDFNGDGKADILWRYFNGDLAMWQMNGGQILTNTLISNVPNNWSVVGTGDFDGDGKADILWRDDQGNVAIWFMDGATVRTNALIGHVPTSWSIVASNGNEIFWRNTSGDTALWIMNGAQIVSNVYLGNVPVSWGIAGIGDFDGDGNTDIIWEDLLHNVAIWLLNGSGGIVSNNFVANVPGTWAIYLTGDFDGDGKSDLLWHDFDGNTAIWLMNGGTVTSNIFLANVSTDWSIQGAGAE